MGVMRAVLWFVALLGVCVCGVQSVQAQEILTLFSKPLPKVETVPENEFLSKTQQVIEYPVGAKELSYELRIPNDWKKADDVSVGSFVVSDRIISNLAKYVGPVTMDGVQHKVMVQAIGVEY